VNAEIPDLPPEPGSVPSPDHGVPGDADPFDEVGERTILHPEDYHDQTRYPDDDDEPDAFDGQTGIGEGNNDGLDEPEDDQ
jgi:hypothetical protein